MDFRQLQYFVRVAELGSFSRAAAFLKVGQPALSRQIQNLEEQHREALFLRNGRGVEPTEAGQRLLSHARGILRLIDRMNEDMENARTGKAGRVAIGMPATLSATISTPLVRRLREQMPDMHVTLTHGRSTQLQEFLLNGRLDMALVLDAPTTPLLESHQISVRYIMLVGAKSMLDGAPDPIPLAELSRFPMVIPSRPNKVRLVLDTEMARIGAPLEVVLESDSLDTCFTMAKEGVGCTLRLDGHNLDTAGMVARKIVNPELPLKSHIILPARRPISRLQDTAFEIFNGVCKELLH